MSESRPDEENLAEEMTKLGNNLVDLLHSVWNRPEREKLQQEIETGLIELGGVLKREADNFAQSDAAQRMKSDIEDLGERVRNKEFESEVRSELVSALKIVNNTLTRVSTDLADKQDESQERTNRPEDSTRNPEPPIGA